MTQVWRWVNNHVLHRGRFPDGARWQQLGWVEQPWDGTP